MQVQEAVTRPVPTHLLGPAPARMVPAAVSPAVQPQASVATVRRLPWVAKRLSILCTSTILFASAYYLTGFHPLKVLGIGFPIVYWGVICHASAKIWGPPAGTPTKGILSERSGVNLNIECYFDPLARIRRGEY